MKKHSCKHPLKLAVTLC